MGRTIISIGPFEIYLGITVRLKTISFFFNSLTVIPVGGI
jgi:hypothetical protein